MSCNKGGKKNRNCVWGLNDSVWEYVKLIKLITNRMAYSKHIYMFAFTTHSNQFDPLILYAYVYRIYICSMFVRF